MVISERRAVGDVMKWPSQMAEGNGFALTGVKDNVKKTGVLGGGVAGVEAAIHLRKYGFLVDLVSNRPLNVSGMPGMISWR